MPAARLTKHTPSSSLPTHHSLSAAPLMEATESPSFVPRRTMHACSQCRGRKQKCGGPTDRIKCAVCERRRVSCSFEHEAKDPRFAPYLIPNRLEGSSNEASELRRVRQRLLELEEASIRERDSPGERDGLATGAPSLASQPQPWNAFQGSPPTGIHNPSPQSSANQNSTSQTQSNHRQGPSPVSAFAGPMRVLQDMGAGDVLEGENHHPVARQILTMGEMQVCFRIFFTKCFANAPFLDVVHDSDPLSVQNRSVPLLLNIVAVGARFWGQSSGTDTWLHPRYRRLVELLDKEMSRLTLHPRPSDSCIETIQAWMLYSHWMPIDEIGPSIRSRFTESSAWQSLGLAIRWATGMGLDKAAHPFSMGNTSVEDVRTFRTMAYLTESDHYLAISARCSPSLETHELVQALPHFLTSQHVQPTDTRLAALLRTAHAAHVMEDRATSAESIEAFSFDVDLVEKDFLSTAVPGLDTMSQHFPYTSLRWYRLAFASTILPASGSWRANPTLRRSTAWASQILSHLSVYPGAAGPLVLDDELARALSFAIDQYFVVVAYAASFLVLAWREGAIDSELNILEIPMAVTALQTSTLYRLVDLAARMIERCSPAKGHLGSRYVPFLRGLATMLLVQEPTIDAAGSSQPMMENQWDHDWLSLWENSGLEQGWLFGSLEGIVGSDG